MSLLSKLTIIIPTYNRQRYALRNMEYWSGSEVCVYVLDGSADPISPLDIKEFSSNIHYYHIVEPIWQRIYFGAQLIKTEYAMLCGDDEFMIQSGIQACLEFLEINKTYSVCIGRCVGFRLHKNKIKLFPVKEYHKIHEVNQENVASRIDYHIRNYMTTTIYGVHRTASFKYCFELSIRENFSCPYSQETLIELFAAAYGKSKVLSHVTWIRSFENVPIQFDSWERKYQISDWYDDPNKKEEIGHFHSYVDHKLSLLCSGEELEAARIASVNALEVRIGSDRVAKVKNISSLTLFYLSLIGLPRRVLGRIIRVLTIHEKPSYFVNKHKYSYENLKNNFEIKLNDNELNELMSNILAFYKESTIINEL